MNRMGCQFLACTGFSLNEYRQVVDCGSSNIATQGFNVFAGSQDVIHRVSNRPGVTRLLDCDSRVGSQGKCFLQEGHVRKQGHSDRADDFIAVKHWYLTCDELMASHG